MYHSFLSLNVNSKKYTAKWLFTGVAVLSTKFYLDLASKKSSVLVTGYPRSGTSWISEILSSYYGLPCFRKYKTPKFTSQVFHTHSILYPRLNRSFYVSRSLEDVLVSLFAKRFNNSANEFDSLPSTQLEDAYFEFVVKELRHPHESPIPWHKHVSLGFNKFGSNKFITYTNDLPNIIEDVSSAIKANGYNLEVSRLNRCFELLEESLVYYTTQTPSHFKQKLQALNNQSFRIRSLLELEYSKLEDCCPKAYLLLRKKNDRSA
jgi:hypothetical protein